MDLALPFAHVIVGMLTSRHGETYVAVMKTDATPNEITPYAVYFVQVQQRDVYGRHPCRWGDYVRSLREATMSLIKRAGY